MKVRWTASAVDDRAAIFDFIASDNPGAAVRLDEIFEEATATLAHFPGIGRPGAIPGTRELLPHEHYRIVYEIDDDEAWILALVHTARRWPPARPPGRRP